MSETEVLQEQLADETRRGDMWREVAFSLFKKLRIEDDCMRECSQQGCKIRERHAHATVTQ